MIIKPRYAHQSIQRRGDTIESYEDVSQRNHRFYPDVDVPMFGNSIIQVGPGEYQKSIGTNGLAGCYAIAALVEDENGIQRCGLAHYDPLSIALELNTNRGLYLPRVEELFKKVCKGDKKFPKKTVIIMSQVDYSGSFKAPIKIMEMGAHIILRARNLSHWDDEIMKIEYAGFPADFLQVTLKGQGKNPIFDTQRNYSKEIKWNQ